MGQQSSLPVGHKVHRALPENFPRHAACRVPAAGSEDLQGHRQGVTIRKEIPIFKRAFDLHTVKLVPHLIFFYTFQSYKKENT